MKREVNTSGMKCYIMEDGKKYTPKDSARYQERMEMENEEVEGQNELEEASEESSASVATK